MNPTRLTSIGLVGLFLWGSLSAHADTDSDRLKRLEDQIKALQEQVLKLRDDQLSRDRERTISLLPDTKKQMDGRKPDTMAGPPALKWSGDITTRFDLTGIHSRGIGTTPEGDSGFFRGRFRLRLQAPLSQRSEAELYFISGNAHRSGACNSFHLAYRYAHGSSFHRSPLHDARILQGQSTESAIRQAIMMHAADANHALNPPTSLGDLDMESEAYLTIKNFLALSASQQTDLINFLKTL